jgi:hypothetical protein
LLLVAIFAESCLSWLVACSLSLSFQTNPSKATNQYTSGEKARFFLAFASDLAQCRVLPTTDYWPLNTETEN